MNYNELSQKAHENAVNHGFWNEKNSTEHCLMLIITEIAEMVEADRNGKVANIKQFNEDCNSSGYFRLFGKKGFKEAFEANIKNTIQDEMADVVIRLCDLSGSLGINFDVMQECRYFRAFTKFTFTENCFALSKGLCKENIAIARRIQFGIHFVESWAKEINVNLDNHIALKMAYNLSRKSRHGKKY